MLTRNGRRQNAQRAAGEGGFAPRYSADFAPRPSRRAPHGHGLRAALLCVCAVLASAAPAAAQQAAPAPQPAASRNSGDSPTLFVTRLRAEPVGYQVKLTWVDSPDLKGTCVVYRSGEEITSQTLARATVIGSVDTGVGFYIDTPPDRSGWYYAVLIRETSGVLHSLLVQFRNKTSAPVAAQTSAPEEQLAAVITGIRAAPTEPGDVIEVSFAASNPSRDLLLFWGPNAFSRSEDLLKATRTTPMDPGTTRYALAVLPGVDYWFAVLDAGLFKLGQAPLVKGANATAYPVQLPVTASHGLPGIATASSRGIPLPSLTIDRGVQTGQQIPQTNIPDLPAPRAISDATKKSIAALQQLLTPSAPKALHPEVLPSDATPTPGGELARLLEIVQGPFLGGDLPTARDKLTDFLSLPRKPELNARARFYLGQIDYFQGNARDALLEFLTAQDFYYEECATWIHACYASLEEPGP